MLHLKKIIVLLLLSVNVFAQNKFNHNPQAFALNSKAFKLLIAGGDGTMLSKTQFNFKVLKILDSATKIEPLYISAHSNKLGPLLATHQNAKALATVKYILSIKPDDLNLLIKQGVIYEVLNKQSSAISSYKEAYSSAINLVSKGNRKTVRNDLLVAYILPFYKNKKSAIDYLSNISQYFKNEKDMKEISYLKKLIELGDYNLEGKKKVFNSYSTL